MQRDKYQYLRRAAMLEVYGMEPISFVRKLCVFDNCLNRETRFFNLRSVRMCDVSAGKSKGAPESYLRWATIACD